MSNDPDVRALKTARIVDKVFTQITLDLPFFAAVGITFPREVGELPAPYQHSPAATDGRVIRINSNVFPSLSQETQYIVMLHEIGHIVFKHPILKKRMAKILGAEFNDLIFQMAADYAVNGLIFEATKMCVLEMLYRQDYTNLSVEELYFKLLKEHKKNQEDKKKKQQGNAGGGGDGSGNSPDGSSGDGGGGQQPSPTPNKHDMGSVLELGDIPDETQEQYESDLNQTISNAVASSAKQGKVPANFAREFNKSLEQKISWQELLCDILFKKFPEDWSRRHPNRYWLQQDIVMPTLYEGKTGEIVIAVDTSGSIDVPQLSQFVAEVEGIRKAFKNLRVIVIGADTHVRSTQIFEHTDIIDTSKIQLKGGGGTQFGPTLEWAKKNAPEAAVLVYMTDGEMYSQLPDSCWPDYPVIWCLTHPNEYFSKRIAGRGRVTTI